MTTPPTETRSCGDCTRCCEGWLRATVRGHPMSPGTPCYYLRNGTCSDYAGRPKEPCRDYACAWLADDSFPEWLKPSTAGVVITARTLPDKLIPYYEVVETGAQVDSAVLNWLIRWALATGTNLIYQVAGRDYTLGSQEFIDAAPPATVAKIQHHTI